MCVSLFPLSNLYAKFTNWAMLLTFAFISLCSYFALQTDIHKQPGKLAVLHVLYELAFAFNVLVVILYWGVIHAKKIVDFDGMIWLHFYLVHSFPAIALWMTKQTF